MPGPAATSYHDSIAKEVAKSVNAKPPRAAAIIAKAIEHKIKNFPCDGDKDMQIHVAHVYKVLMTSHGTQVPDIAAQIKKVKAPEAPAYKAVKGKYGQVSAKLVEEFCLAEKNVTEDKIKDACNTAAKPKGDSGVKVLEGHKKYTAELKITGAGKRLYATAAPSGVRYTFVELGKHT
jgi:hypothetical protein